MISISRGMTRDQTNPGRVTGVEREIVRDMQGQHGTQRESSSPLPLAWPDNVEEREEDEWGVDMEWDDEDPEESEEELFMRDRFDKE